jgi:hypothetical protein
MSKEEEEWIEFYSESKNQKYWFHPILNKSVWTKPTFTSVDETKLNINNNAKNGLINNQTETTTATTVVGAFVTNRQFHSAISAEEGADDAWVEFFSNSKNMPYWFNTKTSESVWSKPCNPSKKSKYEKEIQSSVETLLSLSYTSDKQLEGIKDKKENENEMLEDYPLLALERDRLCESCLTLLANENEKFGKMQGNTKTSRSCNTSGMKEGMKGILARVVWTQLLYQVYIHGDVGASIHRKADSIFPCTIFNDVAVEKEFIDGGRSKKQASEILKKLTDSLVHANAAMFVLRQKISASRQPLSNQIIVLECITTANANGKCYGYSGDELMIENDFFYELSFESKKYVISGIHLLKMLTLYKLHTNAKAVITDQIFVFF